MDISELKQALRDKAHEARNKARSADVDRAGEAAANQRLIDYLTQHHGAALSGYMPIKSEISPLAAMADWSGHSLVSLPVVMGRALPLEFRNWYPGAPMEEGGFGTSHPANPVASRPEILILPLLAFDRKGGRLGYGAGHYDRTLAQLRAEAPARAVGFAYAAQELDEVPCEETDMPLDAIITEHELILPQGKE